MNVEKDEKNWTKEIIRYFMDSHLSSDKLEEWKLQIKATKYCLIEDQVICLDVSDPRQL